MSSSFVLRILPGLIALLGFGHSSLAQSEIAGTSVGYHLRNWTTREGIPQNSVLDIAQAADGGLWISTEAGVALAYGDQFEVFELDEVPNLNNNRIHSLASGRDGTTWLGVSAGQLLRSTGEGWEMIHSPWDENRNQIRDIVEDLDGGIWAASQQGIAIYQRSQLVLLGDLHESVNDLEVLSTGEVLGSCESGLYQFRKGPEGKWAGERLVAGPVGKLAELTDGRVVYSRDSKLWNLDGTLFSGGVSLRDGALEADLSGGLWASTQEGLMHFDGQSWARPATQDPDALGPTTIINAIHVHPDGYVWIGTSRKGLFQLYPTPVRGYPIEGEPAESINMVGVDAQENVWAFGTSTALLVDGKLQVVNGRGCNAAAATRDGSFFWTMGEEGLARFRDGQFENHALGAELPSGLCRALLEDSKGHLWIGFLDRLVRIEGSVVREVPPAPGSRFGQIRTMVEDPSGGIWVAGQTGLTRYMGQDVRHWRRGQEIPRSPVRALLATANGDLWLGGYGGGLSVLRNDEVTSFSSSSGLHENVVTAIHEDGQGSLVLLGNQGVSLVSLKELNATYDDPTHQLAVRLFDACPGLTTVEGNSVSASPAPRAADGTIWFPTLEGLVSYNPAQLLPRDSVADIYLSIELPNGRHVNTNPGEAYALELPADRRSFELAYRTPSFSPFSKVLYRFRLRGVNPGWNLRHGSGTAWFHRLGPGTYQFEIQAALKDHEWGPLHAGVNVVVLPFFHETLWFRILAGLAIGGLLYLVIRWRTRRIARHNKWLASVIADRTRDLRLQIREREGAEASLQAAHDALELAVLERTRELASTLKALEADVAHRESLEVRLKESEKMEIVGRLAGGIAHDFNNILTAVLGEAELARMEAAAADNADLTMSMDNIASNVERASRLTRQLLAYSRQQVLQPIVIDPRRHLSGIEEMLQRLTPASVRLSIELAGEGNNVRMDPGQLEQVLVNLVVNAGEAMQQAGEVRVWIEETTKSEAEAEELGIVPGKYVVLNVMDEGDGMRPETASRMFEPFFSTKYMSRGLGLASVHGIVHQSGGTIEVRTGVGEGTTFRVLLPAVKDPVKQYVIPGPVEKVPSKEAARILICDDEEQVLNVLRISLERRGYDVQAVNSPRVALELVKTMEPKPDLLISDMAMPEMDGFTLARSVKEAIGAIPTIFITGYSLEVLAEGDVRPTGAILLQKPFTADELQARVDEALMMPSK